MLAGGPFSDPALSKGVSPFWQVYPWVPATWPWLEIFLVVTFGDKGLLIPQKTRNAT
jgi:hypothetical protein